MKQSKQEKNHEDEFYASLGKRLRRMRLQYGYTQEQVAEILGIAPDHYGKLERGESYISIAKISQMNEFMKMDMNYLITGEMNEPSYADLAVICSETQYNDMKNIIKSLYNLAVGRE